MSLDENDLLKKYTTQKPSHVPHLSKRADENEPKNGNLKWKKIDLMISREQIKLVPNAIFACLLNGAIITTLAPIILSKTF